MERGVLVRTRLWLGSWLRLHISHRMQDGHTLEEKQQTTLTLVWFLWHEPHVLVNISSFSNTLRSLPAFVCPFRGEFVAAAAVWGVPKWSIWGGRARLGPHYAANGASRLLGPIGRFVGTALPREVTAHPLHHLLHHLIFKLRKTVYKLD